MVRLSCRIFETNRPKHPGTIEQSNVFEGRLRYYGTVEVAVFWEGRL